MIMTIIQMLRVYIYFLLIVKKHRNYENVAGHSARPRLLIQERINQADATSLMI